MRVALSVDPDGLTMKRLALGVTLIPQQIELTGLHCDAFQARYSVTSVTVSQLQLSNVKLCSLVLSRTSREEFQYSISAD